MNYPLRSRAVQLVAMSLLVACAGIADPSGSPQQSVASTISSSSPSSGQLAAWAHFREAVGLRNDELWMRYVATHPDAQTEFPAPLMPFEVADLGRDAASTRQAIGIIRSYGVAFPAEWAGSFVQDGRAVAAFTGNVAAHRVTLEAMLGGSAILDVREARYSMAELADFASDVAADAHRFEALGARFYDASIDESDNVVRVRYLAPGPEQAAAVVAESILEWYGHPAWLLPRWAGPLPWEGPSGGVVIHVVDPAGAPVTGVYCTVAPLDPRVPNGEALWTTDAGGTCRIDRLATVDYEVEIRREPGDSTLAGRAVVSIAADATVKVTVTVDR